MSSPCVILSPSYHNKFDNHTIIPTSNNNQKENLGVAGNINNNNDLSPSANEIIRGPVTLLSSSHGPQRVIMSVFRTSVDHFALVYPDSRRKMIAVKPVGCVNLRGVTCEETTLGSGIKGFTLRPKKCDTSSAALIFICEDASLLPRWLSSLEPSSPVSVLGQRRVPRQCSLPSVEEEE